MKIFTITVAFISWATAKAQQYYQQQYVPQQPQQPQPYNPYQQSPQQAWDQFGQQQAQQFQQPQFQPPQQQPFQQPQTQFQTQPPFEPQPTPQQACTQQMQQQLQNVCARELQNYGVFGVPQPQSQPAPNALTWDGIRRRSRQLFQQICAAFENWDRCAAPYKAACFYVEPIKGQYTVSHEALAYICRPPAYTDMVANWDCLLQASSRSELMMCEAQIMADARGNTYMNLREGDTACKILQDYVSCIKKPLFDQCGAQAWNHVREAFQRPTQVYLPTCTLAGANILPSVLTVFVLLLVALIHRT